MTRARRILLVLAALSGIGAGVGYAATLAVTSSHLWAGTQALTKGSCTLTGTSQTTDTYVDQNKPTNQFGGTSTMLVKPSSTTAQWTLIRFDLSSCSIPASGGADNATLSLRITSAPSASRTLTVTPIGSSWSASVNWNGAQSLGFGSPTTTFSTGKTNNVTVSFPVTVDVDALINSSSANYGWVIQDLGSSASGSTTTFASSNAGSNRPQLVINYEK